LSCSGPAACDAGVMQSDFSLLILGIITAPMSRRRTVLAFVVAPLIVPFVFYLPFPGESAGASNPSAQGPLFGPLIYSLYALPIAYVAEFLLGVPGWMVFRRYRVRSLPAFAAAGALIGWLVNLAMEVPTGDLATKPFTVLFDPLHNPYISICVVAASSSAILFRTIVFSGDTAKGNQK
jgi:hypothetical protein